MAHFIELTLANGGEKFVVSLAHITMFEAVSYNGPGDIPVMGTLISIGVGPTLVVKETYIQVKEKIDSGRVW